MRIGIVGAGRIGATMARLWADAGHDVRLSSRHPEQLESLTRSMGPRVSTGTSADAMAFGEVVMLTVPLTAINELAGMADLVAGKIVIDTGNAYEHRDGQVAREAVRHQDGSAGWAAAMFPAARWVKAFNTVNFKVLQSEAHRDGPRVGIPIASDDGNAAQIVERLVRDAGFDPVTVGPLGRGKDFEPGTPVYNTGMSGPELRDLWKT